MLCSVVGSFWRLRTCQVPDKASCCLLCPLAGRSGRTTWEEPTLSIMRAEPHSGNDPQCSKTAPLSPAKLHRLPCWCSTDSVCCKQGQWCGDAKKTEQQYGSGACFYYTQTDLRPRWELHARVSRGNFNFFNKFAFTFASLLLCPACLAFCSDLAVFFRSV